MRLSKLQIGQKAKVTEIRSPELELALMKLGLLRGDEIRMNHQAPWNGPLALQVNGTQIALRRSDAEHIEIELRNEQTS